MDWSLRGRSRSLSVDETNTRNLGNLHQEQRMCLLIHGLRVTYLPFSLNELKHSFDYVGNSMKLILTVILRRLIFRLVHVDVSWHPPSMQQLLIPKHQ